MALEKIHHWATASPDAEIFEESPKGKEKYLAFFLYKCVMKKWRNKKLWKKYKKNGRKNDLGCCYLECIIPIPLKNSCCKQLERWMEMGKKKRRENKCGHHWNTFWVFAWMQSRWCLQTGHLLYDNACICWEEVSSCCVAQLHVSTWLKHLPFFGINELPISELSTLYWTHREAEFCIITSGGSA